MRSFAASWNLNRGCTGDGAGIGAAYPRHTLGTSFTHRHADVLFAKENFSTNDFPGHLANNTNLSIKEIDALAADADLAKLLHYSDGRVY